MKYFHHRSLHWCSLSGLSCSEALQHFHCSAVWFLTLCKLSYMQRGGRAPSCSLLDPVSLRARVEGCPLYGPKETGAGLCVCMRLILAAVFLSHTVGPTSCFHCPSLLPRERREEGERDGSPDSPCYRMSLTAHFHRRCDLGDLFSGDFSFVLTGDLLFFFISHYLFILVFCWGHFCALQTDDLWFQALVNHEKRHIYCLKQGFKSTLPSRHIPQNLLKRCYYYSLK